MAEGTSDASGKQLAADFQEIRQQRGLSVEELHEETKIPRLLIESFEETALFGHTMFNRVYLRSFVRSYAELVGIAPEAALQALDEALEGRYQGRLRQIYLEGKGPQEGVPDAEEAETGRPRDRETERNEVEDPSLSVFDPPVISSEEPFAEEEGPHAEAGGREPVAPGGETKPPSPGWSAQSPSGEVARPGQMRYRSRRRSMPSLMTWAAVGAGLLVVGAILFIVLRTFEFPPDPTVGTSTPPADTAGTPAQTSPPVNVELGRMMAVTVVAEGGPVRALRITRDSDLRRPYWIEAGQATIFPAEERVIIENPLDGRNELADVRILLEGFPYPASGRDEQGRIVITRQTAQAFLDGVRGQPAQLSTPPDTNYIPVPQ